MTQRNTSCLVQFLTTPNTNSSGWWLSCPWPCQIPLQLCLPPLEMLTCFQVVPWMHCRFHEEDLHASDVLKRKISSRQFLRAREPCYTMSTLDYTFIWLVSASQARWLMNKLKPFLNPQRLWIYLPKSLQLVRSLKEIALDQNQESAFKISEPQQTSFHFSSVSYLRKHTMQWHAHLVSQKGFYEYTAICTGILTSIPFKINFI